MAKKGGTFVCVPCGMEIVVTESGAAYSEIICCGEIMEPGAKKEAPVKKAVRKKAPARKTAVKKAPVKKAPAKKAAGKKAPAKKTARKKAARKK